MRLCPLFFRMARSPSDTVSWAEAYLHTKWHLNPSCRLATTDMAEKMGAGAPLGEAGSPSNTMAVGRGLYLHAKFHLDSSNHLATIYKRHRQDRTDIQDNGLIA